MTLLKSSVKNRHTPCTGMENKYKKAKRYRCIVHILGLSLYYASKTWNNRFARKVIIPLCLVFIAYVSCICAAGILIMKGFRLT